MNTRFVEETRDRISLKKEIEQLRDLNMQLSVDANNLVTALKGESKTQGDWGEFRLEMILEKAGLQKNDLITGINGVVIVAPPDFQKVDLNPGDTAVVTILRDGTSLQLPVEIMPSPDDPEKGLVGIMRENALSYKPVYNIIEWDPQVSMFLLWLWMISFFIGIINMLPLPILDGGKFIQTIIDKKVSEKKANGTEANRTG